MVDTQLSTSPVRLISTDGRIGGPSNDDKKSSGGIEPSGRVILDTLRTYSTIRFNNWLDQTGVYFSRLRRKVSPYSMESMRRRISQEIVTHAFDSFCKSASQEFHQGSFDYTRIPESGAGFGGISIERGTGRIRVHWKRRLRFMALFLSYWLFVLGRFLNAALRSFGAAKGAAAVVNDIGAYHVLGTSGTDADFIRYCREGNLDILREVPRLLVQSTAQPRLTDPSFCTYSRWPLFTLIEENQTGPLEIARFLVRHLSALITYFRCALLEPSFCLLARDFAFSGLVEHLDARSLITSWILTDANATAQYLYMADLPKRRFSLHLVWHGQNTRAFAYKVDPIVRDIPFWRFLRVDHFWAWSPGFAEWLKETGAIGTPHVVGPLVWRLPQGDRNASNDVFRICVFDVTPPHSAWRAARGWEGLYYNYENCRQFLVDILDEAADIEKETGLRVEVCLKHKRAFTSSNDMSYGTFVEGLEKESRWLKSVPPHLNIFELVRGTDVVIAAPFTSAALVAWAESIPSAYYDPIDLLQPLKGLELPVLYGRQELRDFIRGQCRHKKLS